jgi:hypothetical protein
MRTVMSEDAGDCCRREVVSTWKGRWRLAARVRLSTTNSRETRRKAAGQLQALRIIGMRNYIRGNIISVFD